MAIHEWERLTQTLPGNRYYTLETVIMVKHQVYKAVESVAEPVGLSRDLAILLARHTTGLKTAGNVFINNADPLTEPLVCHMLDIGSRHNLGPDYLPQLIELFASRALFLSFGRDYGSYQLGIGVRGLITVPETYAVNMQFDPQPKNIFG